jgi:hypothetical protein
LLPCRAASTSAAALDTTLIVSGGEVKRRADELCVIDLLSH